MPGLIERITSIFRKAQPPAETTTALDIRPTGSRATEIVTRFAAETGRAEVVKRCREMYEKDPRAEKMHITLAQDLVRGGFTINCSDSRAVEVAEALRKRLKLDQRLDDWVRLSARDGDSFLELSINERLEVVDVTRKPTLQMHRDSDSSDRFADPERAFWWADDAWSVAEAPGDALWFAEWQIVHARWKHDEGSRYGTPMMSAGTGHYKKVSEGELDIAVRRKTRAGMKYNHKFPDSTNAPEIEAYKEINKDALDNPFAAAADFFGTTDISVIQGDARLGEITDVRHMIATWLSAGAVPMELMFYGEDLNRDVLGEKRAQYDAQLDQGREWVSAQLIVPLLERQWLLAGIYPPSLDYSIEWRTKKEPAAVDVVAIADAGLKLRTLGVKPDIVARVMAQFLPGVDPDDLLVDEEDDADTAGRIAGVLAGLGNGDADANAD